MIRTTAFGAAPQINPVTANSRRPMRNSLRRPYSSPSRPAGTSVSPKASANPATAQVISAGVICKLRSIEGSAMVTILTSSRVMKLATRQISSADRRWGSAFPGPLSAVFSTGHHISRIGYGAELARGKDSQVSPRRRPD